MTLRTITIAVHDDLFRRLLKLARTEECNLEIFFERILRDYVRRRTGLRERPGDYEELSYAEYERLMEDPAL